MARRPIRADGDGVAAATTNSVRTARTRMTVRFAAYAGVALVLAAAAGAWVARHHAGAQARKGVNADTRAIAERLAGDDLASLALRGPIRGSDLADLDELFGHQTLNDDTVRVTLYDRNGRVTYSTAHELIGTTADTARVRTALEGDGRMMREGDVLRDFAPVHWLLADASFPNGVIAVDYDWGPVAREIRDRT